MTEIPPVRAAITEPMIGRRFGRGTVSYDCYTGVAGHALCNAHLLRELTAVTETRTAQDWAQQAIDALLELKNAANAARAAGHKTIVRTEPPRHWII